MARAATRRVRGGEHAIDVRRGRLREARGGKHQLARFDAEAPRERGDTAGIEAVHGVGTMCRSRL